MKKKKSEIVPLLITPSLNERLTTHSEERLIGKSAAIRQAIVFSLERDFTEETFERDAENKTEKISFSLPTEIVERIDGIAEVEFVSRADVIRRCITFYLNKKGENK